MNKNLVIYILFSIVALAIVAGIVVAGNSKFKTSDDPDGCTKEAKVCPDGSSVGRVAPLCEFAPCPAPSGIKGTVFTGPHCPVVQIGMEEECADRPYEGNFALKTRDGSREIKKFNSNARGEFQVFVSPDTYLITTSPENIFPRCDTEVVVEKDEMKTIQVSCDTGIR